MTSTPSNVTVYASPVMRKLAAITPDLQPSLRKVADFILRHKEFPEALQKSINEIKARIADSSPPLKPAP